MLGYFAKLPRECPPKKIQQKAKSPPSKRDTSRRRGSSPTGTITSAIIFEPRSTVTQSPPPGNPPRKNFEYTDQHLTACIRAKLLAKLMESFDTPEDTAYVISIAATTVQRYYQKVKDAIDQNKNKTTESFDIELFVANMREKHQFNQKAIIQAQQQFLSTMASDRDFNNSAMTAKEMVSEIERLTGRSKPRAAEDHLNYLIQAKQFLDLKNFGQTVVAQK